MANRTGIDFSAHELIVTVQDGLLVHYLKKPDTHYDSIKYINTNGVLVVTGDYSNWMFCREFHPSANGRVSDSYWVEKLHLSSTQNGKEYDSEATKKALQDELDGGLEKYGYEGEELEQVKEYMQECLALVDDEHGYEMYAYREAPSCFDTEGVIMQKKVKEHLAVVFDGFEEICRRIQIEETLKATTNETCIA